MKRRPFLHLGTVAALLAATGSALAAAATSPVPAWSAVEAAAKGQTVYWNAWAGDEQTNAFIAWVGEQGCGRRTGSALTPGLPGI